MAFLHTALSPAINHPIYSLFVLPILFLVLRILQRIYFSQLSHIPGPARWAATSSFLNYNAWNGTECRTVHALHLKHGSFVRTGPNSVDIADGDALAPIYVEKGGFRKTPFYANFDIDGHKSIFSEIDPASRMQRAKAVLPLFSTGSLRNGSDVIYSCVDKMVNRMKEESLSRMPVNVLNLTRSLATDVVSAYLFGESYDGLEEKEEHLSASGMVNSFVAVGRFWYLPSWTFQALEWLNVKIWDEPEVANSMEKVDNFVKAVVEKASMEKSSGTYPARLLEAGITQSETRAQCKDLIFAGTDSTGMNLATICFMLAKHPECYQKLKKEILEGKPTEPDLQSLPYLQGVVREGSRLSMANPSRLPRLVPTGGWTFKGTYLPQGTAVSCTPYELHLDPSVFEDPLDFNHERWQNATERMIRDSIPFGLGTRQCIARNLATMELYCAVQRLVEEAALNGARCCSDRIDILEWFNSKVVGEKIELQWDAAR
jgi:cytochrome P450